ncbi:hypothetical protein N9A80_01770 [Rhodopirellula sp.]|nr:hypothetical protein [Rhodopirellula sp.]MDA9934369.1 hypothetical protein [Rubripirellula sp.]
MSLQEINMRKRIRRGATENKRAQPMIILNGHVNIPETSSL